MSDALHPQAQRLDQWLWFSRLTKSRTLAQALIERGKVRINRARIEKPSHPVKAGDVLTFSMGPYVRVYEICALGIRRGPATEAAALYRELTKDPDRSGAATGSTAAGQVASGRPQAQRDAGAGRPTKRERRQTERLKGRFDDV